MAQVYNWQLGRMMSFPYEERHPRWQFAFVFNINRCIACQTCTMACTSTWTFARGQEAMWWNNVEIKPFGGYPRHWDARLLAMLEEANPGGQVWNLAPREDRQRPYGVFEGKTIFEAAEKRVGPEGPQAVLGYLPTDDEWRSPNVQEDCATGRQNPAGTYQASAALPVQEGCDECLAGRETLDEDLPLVSPPPDHRACETGCGQPPNAAEQPR